LLKTSDAVGALDADVQADAAPDAEAQVETDIAAEGLRDTEGEAV
jgi:hypothetical protein